MFKKIWKVDKRLLLFIGVFAGIIFSVVTVKTLAYTDSPEFCSGCHIMTEVHNSFTDSNHAGLSCGDCHLPHDNVVNKYTYKAKAGMNHVYYNTLGEEKIPKVLHPVESTEQVVNENCIDCHENTLNNVSHDSKDSCVTCHQSVPHGKGFKTEDFYKAPKPGELLENKGGTFNNG
ncbi:cytochrome c3 family protein [Mesobacillus harenae]|uniref:cytochrome c3 family protein n=1 Tax=Mesobacillus harenae TaxID=2213203 RepID=UPI0015807DED|nr:NapC/NirT family cytochrome c [Mesobacillus harenae]